MNVIDHHTNKGSRKLFFHNIWVKKQDERLIAHLQIVSKSPTWVKIHQGSLLDRSPWHFYRWGQDSTQVDVESGCLHGEDSEMVQVTNLEWHIIFKSLLQNRESCMGWSEWQFLLSPESTFLGENHEWPNNSWLAHVSFCFFYIISHIYVKIWSQRHQQWHHFPEPPGVII